MLRALLEFVLILLVVRAVWCLLGGIVQGAVRTRPVGPAAPGRSVPMARDPVCGTFVLPERAVTVFDGRQRVHFCSTTCRDTYQARPSTGSGRPDSSTGSGSSRATSRDEPVEGRTA